MPLDPRHLPDPTVALRERTFDFARGELLLVDKPGGWTSFDVVNRLRYRLRKLTGVKRIKVGHSGTLDPMATGLLLVATGKATKALTALTGLPKTYTGVIRFGGSTPSYDADTEVDAEHAVGHLTEERIRDTAQAEFTGWIEQTPPVYSAIKVGGKRAYKSAHAGKALDMPTRRVHVERFEITAYEPPDARFEVACSKGTYVRSLAHDLGAACGSGAHLAALRRTRIGDYDLRDADTVDAWSDYLDEAVERLSGGDVAAGSA